MKHLSSFILLALLALTSVVAQTNSFLTEEGEDRFLCGTPAFEEYLRQVYPEMGSREAFEAWLAEAMRQQELKDAGSRAILTIPVVFHIIHRGEAVGVGNNIAQSLVQSQMDVLNEDFRRIVNTPGGNTHPDGADSEIEFCLAVVDPDGNLLAEPGIDRVDGSALGFPSPPFSSSVIEGTIKPATYWDPNRYMNIYVVGGILPNGVAGYAFLPQNPGNVPGLPGVTTGINDGFVVGRSFVGRSGFSGGRTSTHEIGHWLGLLHLSGPGNSGFNCSMDDFCMDTPATDGSNQGRCGSVFACGSQDQVQNYMNGVLAPCFNMFTNCQVSRMRTVLQNSPQRAQLLSSNVCIPRTNAPVPDFALQDTFSCDGRVQFTDLSGEYPSQWFWIFGNGQTSTAQNPIAQYTQSGTYTVTLIASNYLGTNSVQKTITVTIGNLRVNAGPDLDACFGDTVQLDAQITDPAAQVRWSPTTGLSNPNLANPTFIGISNRTYTITVVDSIGCQINDTIGVIVRPNPVLNAGQDLVLAAPDTAVQLQAIATGGPIIRWEWTPAFGFISPPNVPDPIVAPAQTVTYRVKGITAYGCEDEDAVTVTVQGTPPLSIDFETVVGEVNRPFPNPAESMLTFSANLKQSGRLSLSLYDYTGKRRELVFDGTVSPGLFKQVWRRPASLAGGIYLAVWEWAGTRFTQKIQLR